MHIQNDKSIGVSEMLGSSISYLMIKTVIKIILKNEKYCSTVKYKKTLKERNISWILRFKFLPSFFSIKVNNKNIKKTKPI